MPVVTEPRDSGMKEANLTSSANHNLEHMYEELQQRATIDALSGVLNRATLEQCIKSAWKRWSPRTPAPCSSWTWMISNR